MWCLRCRMWKNELSFSSGFKISSTKITKTNWHIFSLILIIRILKYSLFFIWQVCNCSYLDQEVLSKGRFKIRTIRTRRRKNWSKENFRMMIWIYSVQFCPMVVYSQIIKNNGILPKQEIKYCMYGRLSSSLTARGSSTSRKAGDPTRV